MDKQTEKITLIGRQRTAYKQGRPRYEDDPKKARAFSREVGLSKVVAYSLGLYLFMSIAVTLYLYKV